MHCLCTNRK